MSLTEHQIVRFSRQILLREVGGVGQQKLIDATVLEATKSGDGGQRTALKLPPGCSLDRN